MMNPYQHFAAVTTSDANDLPRGRCEALYIGGAGNVSVLDPLTATVTAFNAVPAGTVLRISVNRVRATGTTATGIVALY
jgi:hypothetical protein